MANFEHSNAQSRKAIRRQKRRCATGAGISPSPARKPGAPCLRASSLSFFSLSFGLPSTWQPPGKGAGKSAGPEQVVHFLCSNLMKKKSGAASVMRCKAPGRSMAKLDEMAAPKRKREPLRSASSPRFDKSPGAFFILYLLTSLSKVPWRSSYLHSKLKNTEKNTNTLENIFVVFEFGQLLPNIDGFDTAGSIYLSSRIPHE